jgi:UDP-sugar transporter A1/2/3
MKKNDDSLHWQNLQLYSFGVLFNMIRLTVEDVSSNFEHGAWPITLFNGYTPMTCCVVANLAFSGLLVSFVMKYADTIAKVSECLTVLRQTWNSGG